MLFMGDYEWFKEFSGEHRKVAKSGKSMLQRLSLYSIQFHVYRIDEPDDHQQRYQQLKDAWKKNALEIFFKYFPKVRTQSLSELP